MKITKNELSVQISNFLVMYPSTLFYMDKIMLQNKFYKSDRIIFCEDKLIINIPNCIKTLHFRNQFNKLINNIPLCVSTIVMARTSIFNQKIDKLPNSIIILIFLGIFNQSIDKLPNSILKIILSGCFNQLVNNLPNSILNASFTGKFNQPVNYLPESILNLTFGCYFKQNINNLPKSIINLNLSYDYIVNNYYIYNSPCRVIINNINRCANLQCNIDIIKKNYVYNQIYEYDECYKINFKKIEI